MCFLLFTLMLPLFIIPHIQLQLEAGMDGVGSGPWDPYTIRDLIQQGFQGLISGTVPCTTAIPNCLPLWSYY